MVLVLLSTPSVNVKRCILIAAILLSTTAAFAQPALGAFGNLPRNAVEGPGRWSIDGSLIRAFDLASAHRVELRLEAFNLLNTTQRGNPVTNLNSPTFGRILSAADPRLMQFAVKYVF